MMGVYGGRSGCSDFGFGIHPIGDFGFRIWDLTAEAWRNVKGVRCQRADDRKLRTDDRSDRRDGSILISDLCHPSSDLCPLPLTPET